MAQSKEKKIEQHRLSLEKELMAGQQTKILKDFKLAQIEQSTEDLWKTTTWTDTCVVGVSEKENKV